MERPLRNALMRLSKDEPRLPGLVSACKTELQASEVWLFGSRARGDARPGSDWDILVVIPSDAPATAEDARILWKIRRASGVTADLLTVRSDEFLAARDCVNTISHAVAREGLRLDA